MTGSFVFPYKTPKSGISVYSQNHFPDVEDKSLAPATGPRG